jgi:ribonuclease HI
MKVPEISRRGGHGRSEARRGQSDDIAHGHNVEAGIVKPFEPEGLAMRRQVVLANRRARKAAKPAYVNTDASWRDGRAGLAYEGALGVRTEVVVCGDNHEAEYLALLMAMGDAERCLAGRIAFRTDSQTVAGLQKGSAGQYEPLRGRVKLLLSRHPEWTLLLVERVRNKAADDLSHRAFRTEREVLGEGEARPRSRGEIGWRWRG